MMHKKVWNWILIAIAIVIIAIIIWLAATGGKSDGDAGAGHTAHTQTNSASDPDLERYIKEQDAVMADMMEAMEGVSPSGSADVDFLAGMLPHHEAAVAMSESYLQSGGKNDTLEKLANDIITAQTEEIKQMQTMLQDKKASGNMDAAKAEAYTKAYHEMMHGHTMAHTAAQSVDEAFAEGMIMHHQMAVDMANAILPNTDDPGISELAQNIIDTQNQEIADMQSILDGLRPAA